jgi:LytS/YehU family sensor histidine kinase
VLGWTGSILGYRLILLLPDRGSPTWIATRYFVCWISIFLLSFLVAGFLVKLILGINVFTRMSIGITLLFCLAIGALITAFQLMKEQVQLSRELALAQARAQSLALQAQLSPHTLFNSLNTIAALIPEQPGLAEETVQRLSRLLRRILSALEQDRWTLAEEFDLVRDLLETERVRFGNRMNFSLSLLEDEAARPVPPLILLPLVENSLKHGFRPKVGHCSLDVTASHGRVVICDNGVGLQGKSSEGVGLSNVRQRLEAIGGNLAWLETMEGCSVEVKLCP